MMLRYSLGLEQEACKVEHAVAAILDDGYRTADLAQDGQSAISTAEMTENIVNNLNDG